MNTEDTIIDTFERKILDYIKKYNMFDGVKHCVCGVSGGADSVSLLTVLAKYRNLLGIELHVVHINHMIRGAAADSDQSYVEKLCRDYGVRCDSLNIDVQSRAAKQRLTVEESGRLARYDAFADVRKRYEQEGCVIAVAHNRNDVAETVLFNLARGTGMGGIKGIAPVRDNIVRPLLACDRSEIEGYLDRMGIPYCTDATNNEDDYTRNKIRHKILPLMEEINDKAVEHICAMAEMAADYERLAADMTADFLRSQGIDPIQEKCGWTDRKNVNRQYSVDRNALTTQGKLIQELVIRQLIGMVCGGLKDIGRNHVSEVMKLYSADTGSGIDLPWGGRAFVQYDRIVFTGKRESDNNSQQNNTDESIKIDMNGDGIYKIGGGCLTVRIYERPEMLDLSKKECTKYLDYDRIKQCLQLRTMEKGDYIVVDSSGSRKKLNRLFTDAKIPADRRPVVPLVAAGSEIVWAIGLRIGENYKVTDNTQRILEMEFTGGNGIERTDWCNAEQQ